MSRLLFLLLISPVLVGCGGEVCGSTAAIDANLMVSGPSVDLAFGTLSAGANNDCPDATAPAGVISLTIAGTEVGGAGLVTFCIPRPDLLETEALPFGTGVRIVDLNGSDASCAYSVDRAIPATGTVSSTGLCGNGTDSRGFSLAFQGAVNLRRTCGVATDSVEVQLQGHVAVAAPELVGSRR